MRRSNMQAMLEAGRPVVGEFAPAGADFSTPGVLTWSAEGGAELELADLSDPWPRGFDDTFAVHGRPHDGEALTLLHAQVKSTTSANRTSKLRSWTLALGAHTTMADRWLHSNYRPGSLHEWLPESGLSIGDLSDDGSRLVVEWNAPEKRTVEVPGGDVTLSPGADWKWSYAPDWSIETSMTFGAKADESLTIDEHWSQFGNPLLSFSIFAVDRPDDLTYESYYSPDDRRQIVVLRGGREAPTHEWRPTKGHYLFQGNDLEDPVDALAKWFAVWHKTVPALGLLAEVITTGNTFTVPRFLTLYTAAEGYWKGMAGGAQWNLGQLAKRADVPETLTGATQPALALIGASRNYHAHLAVDGRFSPEEIVDQTYESTRRLHALLQACLMREVGIDTAGIERLLKQHYVSWPVP